MAKNAYIFLVLAWTLWLGLGAFACIEGAMSGVVYLAISGVVTAGILGSATWLSIKGKL